MISKHVDLIAVGILLAAIALFNGARQMVVLTMGGPVHYFRMDNGREVHLPDMPETPQVPEVPRVPRIPLQSD